VRRAFTLVELLAAMALSAVLMLAVFQVVGTLGRTRAVMIASAGQPLWHDRVRELLRRDLAQSSLAKFEPSALTLIGSASIRSAMQDVTHEPVMVTYTIRSLHGRPWLVRQQAGRVVRGTEKPFVELVCPDVAEFAVASSQGVAVASPEGQAIPGVVAVTFRMTSGETWGGDIVVR
jgi:prepilin-type N-terminal cleavage/methylation domain-containing protein